MAAFRTAILEKHDDVDRRLADFGLMVAQVEAIALAARTWAADASPLMPLNAPGTLAYIYGVQELRRQILGGDWQLDRACGIEAVLNRSLNLRIGYQNVDRAWDGITTVHQTAFMQSPRFARAYARAVQAGGWDYRIPFRVHQALWCSRLAQRVEGDFVELGTGRGFVMSALLEDGLTRPLHLFDTFLPNSLDSAGAQVGEENLYYAASFESVKANFAHWPNAQLHRGNVYEALPAAGLTAVAFLHVDMNHADPEEFGIRLLWPLMPSGAVMLFDDYAYEGCEPQNERINRLAAELGFDVLTTATGQGIAIK